MKTLAFTLTELLITIAIIVVGTALLLPVLMQARTKGRGISCLSNLMQLSKAQIMYADDHSGSFATAYGAEEPHRYWLTELSPYLKTTNRLRCPAHTSEFPDLWLSTGYAVNGCLTRESSISSPSRLVMFAEVAEVISLQGGAPSPLRVTSIVHPDNLFLSTTFESGDSIGKYAVRKPYGSERHLNGGHYAICDGRGVWLKPSEVRRSDNFSCNPKESVTWQGRADGVSFVSVPQEGSS